MAGRGDMETGMRCTSAAALLLRSRLSTSTTVSRARESSLRRGGDRCGEESLLMDTESGMAISMGVPSSILVVGGGVARPFRLIGCLPLDSSAHGPGGQACWRYALCVNDGGSVDRWVVSS